MKYDARVRAREPVHARTRENLSISQTTQHKKHKKHDLEI